MLHLLYIVAFAILAFLAVGNLIRNLMTLGAESRQEPNRPRPGYPAGSPSPRRVSHPELLDESGAMVKEPYLVMRSISVDDARKRLDALYDSSPNVSDEAHDETL
jgi:hypothetical protein